VGTYRILNVVLPCKRCGLMHRASIQFKTGNDYAMQEYEVGDVVVRHVGEMARRGASVEEIVEDYPNLRKQDVEFAKRYVAAYPRVGRPRAGEAPAR